MKFKSLLALALTLATVGASLPAVAGPGNDGGHKSGEYSNKRHKKYYGNYHYYKLGNSYIYVGSRGDYFDRDGKYYPADRHPEYRQYFSSEYNYDLFGNYYDESGRYYNAKQEDGNQRVGKKYYGNYHYHKLGNSYIYIGSRGDYFDRDGKYYPADRNPEYRQYFSSEYNYDRSGNYYDESGRYYNAK
jgi:hypothetical protein